MDRDTFHQTRLLRAPSNLALNTAREGAATASLGNLCQCLNTLTVKNFFLVSNLNLPSVSLKPLPLVLSLHALVKSPCPAFSFLNFVCGYVVEFSERGLWLLFSLPFLKDKYSIHLSNTYGLTSQ